MIKIILSIALIIVLVTFIWFSLIIAKWSDELEHDELDNFIEQYEAVNGQERTTSTRK